jgi:uncharacterized FAD-dependent dehydrogenase
MEFQNIEQNAWHFIGKVKVPAQRMIDFTQKRVSSDIPKTSYGTTSVEMGAVFPIFNKHIT